MTSADLVCMMFPLEPKDIAVDTVVPLAFTIPLLCPCFAEAFVIFAYEFVSCRLCISSITVHHSKLRKDIPDSGHKMPAKYRTVLK